MEALQMMKFTVKHGHSLDFTAGTSRDVELEVLLQKMDGLNDELEDKSIVLENVVFADPETNM
jgi:hypothetical protein